MSKFLTRYEVARILGLRAMQIQNGADPFVHLPYGVAPDAVYLAARELAGGLLDVVVMRGEERIHVKDMGMPPELQVLIDTKENSLE